MVPGFQAVERQRANDSRRIQFRGDLVLILQPRDRIGVRSLAGELENDGTTIGLADGPAVAALAVHAEGAHALQDPAVDAPVGAEDLPRRHEGDGPMGTAADLHHDVRVAVVAVVGRDEDAVSGAALVQESAPERVELKRELLAQADRSAPPEALVCSSTSGLRPTELQAEMARPERFCVAHPFNPVYLLPLVELCAGDAPHALAAINNPGTVCRKSRRTMSCMGAPF